MALIVTNAGENELLDKMLKDPLTTDEDYTLRLFTNDATLSGTSVIGDLTEATFTGYSAKTLTRSGWTDSTSNGSSKAESSYTQQSWDCTGAGQTIYGYTVQGATSSVLLWAEKFSTSRTLADGDTLLVTPVFTLDSEN